MTKSNMEIIVEEIIDNYKKWIISKERKELLNTELPFWERRERQKAIDQILQLVPEEGIVIEKGEVKYAGNYKEYYIKWDSNEPETSLDAFLSEEFKDLKKVGTKVQLVIRKDKE